jgi:hypothetical protein
MDLWSEEMRAPPVALGFPVLLGKKLHFFGAEYDSDETLDLVTNEWRGYPAGLNALKRTAGAAIGNKIILWGGGANLYRPQDAKNEGVIFDTENGTQAMIPPSPLSARSGHGATAIGSRVVFWGGTSGLGKDGISGNYLSDGAVFDVAENRWICGN